MEEIMSEQSHRRAWALLIVLGSFMAAAAVWSLPEDIESLRRAESRRVAPPFED
jgi:hypothetical protein